MRNSVMYENVPQFTKLQTFILDQTHGILR